MPNEEQLIDERKRKREDLLNLGINPYPYRYEPTATAKEIHKKYKDLPENSATEDEYRVAGRIIALRRMGKVTFMQLLDSTGKIQVFFREDDLGPERYKSLKLYDIGDWLGAEGKVFTTKTGEITLNVKLFDILCKSIRPLPEKWHGLKDIELRYRKRYLDLIMNPDVKETFINKTKMINSIRHYLDKRGYLEVETPVLQPIYGGGAAKPFTSHLNSLDMPVYLRIANELYLKRLIVGGFDKVYEFARVFRNEDIDRTHNPEFNCIEIYEAWADYHDMQKLVEELFQAAATAIHGSTKFEYQGHTIDVKSPWKSYTMTEALKKFADIDIDQVTDADKDKLCKAHQLDLGDDFTKGELLQALFEELVEDKLIEPAFITLHPIESTPLCKKWREKPESELIERFEPYIAGMEIANAYSELNDPILQRKLLEEQAKKLKIGKDKEAHPMDEDFVEAIEYGMPPTGGVGIGVDRMAMILLDKPSIRDVILFPFMKPK